MHIEIITKQKINLEVSAVAIFFFFEDNKSLFVNLYE